jgi:hypothetical protein
METLRFRTRISKTGTIHLPKNSSLIDKEPEKSEKLLKPKNSLKSGQVFFIQWNLKTQNLIT